MPHAQVRQRDLPSCLHDMDWLEGLLYSGEFSCEGAEDGMEFLNFVLAPLTRLTYLWFEDTSDWEGRRDEWW